MEKLDGEELLRLWNWLVASTPKNEAQYEQLSECVTQLAFVLRPERGPGGKPAINQAKLPQEPIALELTTAGKIGYAHAIAQAITGESHPRKVPAPMGVIQFMCLPIARKLGVEKLVKAMVPWLEGMV